jgi:4-amino-4-deoxy-L-arabinose transferase-like glycosyltransferase
MHREIVKNNGAWLALWTVLVAVALWSRPLIPIDETRYLSVAWEMWQNGEFLVPHSNGVPYSHKPPLLFWLIHLVWAIFGVHEFPARVVAPFFGLVAIFLTMRMGTKLWPHLPRIRGTVPYLMLGALVWSVYSSLTMFDTLLTTFVLLSLHSVYAASQAESPLRNWLAAGVFLGLGILAKGPVIFVYVLPCMMFAPAWVKQKTVSWSGWYAGAAVSIATAAIIALCWALPAASAGGEEYANAILLQQTAGRVVHSFAHNRPFYWYLVILPLLFFPWFLWPPSWLTERKQWLEPGTRFCIICAAGALFLLSCISGKQIHYVLPLMPVVFLLVARNLMNLHESGTMDRFPVFIVLFSLGVVLLFLPLMPLGGGDREILARLPAWLPVIPLVSAVPLLFFRRAPTGAIRLVSLCLMALFVALHLSLQGILHMTYDQGTVGALLEKLQGKTDTIGVYPGELSDQFQFAGRLTRNVYPAQSPGELIQWATRHPGGYSLLYSRNRDDFANVPGRIVSQYKKGWLFVSSNRKLAGGR